MLTNLMLALSHISKWVSDNLSELSNLGTIITGIAAIVALHQTKKQSKAALRPILTPYIKNVSFPDDLFLIIENMGNGSAIIQSISFSQEVEDLLISEASQALEYISNTTLPPKRSIPLKFDVDTLYGKLLLHADQKQNPFIFEVTIQYSSPTKDFFNEKTSINLTFEYSLLTLDTDFLPKA